MKLLLTLLAVLITISCSATERKSTPADGKLRGGFCPSPKSLLGSCTSEPGSQCSGHQECAGEERCCREGCTKVCKTSIKDQEEVKRDWKDWAFQVGATKSNPYIPMSRNQRNKKNIIADLAKLQGSIRGEKSLGPEIALFEQASFQGHSVRIRLRSGCNLVPERWAAKASSIKSSLDCVILWERPYCRGRTGRLSQDEAPNLKRIGMSGMVGAVELCDSGNCTELGLFSSPGSCNKFFRCADSFQNGTLHRYDLTCPQGQIFDGRHGACNRPERTSTPVECSV